MSGILPPHNLSRRTSALLLTGVIGLAVVGYFVGINQGVPHEDHEPIAETTLDDQAMPAEEIAEIADSTEAIPALHYSSMRRLETGPTSQARSQLEDIPQPDYDLFADIKPSLTAKQESLKTRTQRRAYNGAPPIIPHAIERTSDAACYACHGQGMRIGDRVANRMSHGFLANCVQCHAPPPPQPFSQADLSVANDFAGLPTPQQGKRAYEGAPPTIPHSTWMRNECLSCHGQQAGWAGLEVTHPWRANCLQCHAPSSPLEQAFSLDSTGFVPGPPRKQP